MKAILEIWWIMTCDITSIRFGKLWVWLSKILWIGKLSKTSFFAVHAQWKVAKSNLTILSPAWTNQITGQQKCTSDAFSSPRFSVCTLELQHFQLRLAQSLWILSLYVTKLALKQMQLVLVMHNFHVQFDKTNSALRQNFMKWLASQTSCTYCMWI